MRVDEKKRAEISASDETSHPAADAILGANPFVGLTATDFVSSIGQFLTSLRRNPEPVVARIANFAADMVNIAGGFSNIEPDPGDRRFADPAWKENPLYRRVMQSYLAWRSTMHDLVDGGPQPGHTDDWKIPAQERFAVTLLTEALAPTNNLLTNPAAIKRAFDTGGQSLIDGMRHFFDDLVNNGGMPSQVDKRPFKVGQNIAATPGAVVFRNELLEVLQYTPSTAEVYKRPVLFVPPQINKFYILDLAPKRSLTEYALAHGIQFFTVSWRNPGAEHRDWGLDEYVGAIKEAIRVVTGITGSPDTNLLAVCAGGITSSLALGHLAAIGDRRVHSGTLLVTMLDSSQPSMTGMFTTEQAVRAACLRSQQQGVLDGASMARIFAWLRPNDLVWHYWVNNYLMGKEPAPFDILFWNADSTNLPAKLHAGFLDILLRNPLVEANRLQILGTPINLRNVTCDMYILAGLTDHICAWHACHRAARLFGGHAEFVLSASGHVQSLVSPPDNPKAKYFTHHRLGTDPDQWHQAASEHKGTWWDHWLGWLEKRSDEKRPAPSALGSDSFRVLGEAPGTYVGQRP